MNPSPDSHFTELPFLIAGVSLSFQALIKRLRAEMGLRQEIAIGMGSIFFALCENEDCIMKDLAARLRMPKGTLSGLTARMEAMGLIERAECPDDARALRVRLTRKARAMEDALRARHQRATEILQTGLSTTEVTELKRLLGRLLENLRKDQAPTGASNARPTKRRALPAR